MRHRPLRARRPRAPGPPAAGPTRSSNPNYGTVVRRGVLQPRQRGRAAAATAPAGTPARPRATPPSLRPSVRRADRCVPSRSRSRTAARRASRSTASFSPAGWTERPDDPRERQHGLDRERRGPVEHVRSSTASSSTRRTAGRSGSQTRTTRAPRPTDAGDVNSVYRRDHLHELPCPAAERRRRASSTGATRSSTSSSSTASSTATRRTTAT